MLVGEIGPSDLETAVGSGGPWIRIENHNDAILPLAQGTSKERLVQTDILPEETVSL